VVQELLAQMADVIGDDGVGEQLEIGSSKEEEK